MEGCPADASQRACNSRTLWSRIAPVPQPPYESFFQFSREPYSEDCSRIFFYVADTISLDAGYAVDYVSVSDSHCANAGSTTIRC